MVASWRFWNIVCTISLFGSLIIMIFSLGFDYNMFSETGLQFHGDKKNTEFRSFKVDEPIYTLVKRSADNPYPKKATTTNEKKQVVKRTTISPNVNSSKLLLNSVKISTIDNNDDFYPGATFPPNTTRETEDGHHIYYNSTFYKSSEKALPYLVDFKSLPEENITVHQMLSDSYRRAATVSLSFDFPFYGHLLRNITVATGGFLYMEEYVHSWLAATQYIAPLMANFDTSLKNESMVRYVDNGTAFTVQWYKVFLQDRENDGPFTFQVTLTKSGKVIFVYEKIPLSVTEIANHSHPVKVGISDAYTIDRTIYFIRRKTIYEYHRIDMKKDEIGNYTAILFIALPTCVSFNDCESCMSSDINFDCVWCEQVQRCSDGLDRHRQEWLVQNCNRKKDEVKCVSHSPNASYPLPSFDTSNVTTDSNTEKYNTEYTQSPIKSETTSIPTSETSMESMHKSYMTTMISNDQTGSSSARVGEKEKNGSSIGVGGVIAIFIALGVIFGIGVWIIYAYRYPQTPSGQILIKYRPSQWRFRHGEARYTAASIHM